MIKHRKFIANINLIAVSRFINSFDCEHGHSLVETFSNHMATLENSTIKFTLFKLAPKAFM